MANIARLGITFDSSGAKRGSAEAQKALHDLGGTARRTESEMRRAAQSIARDFAGLAGALGATALAREMLQLADSWTRLEGRLKTVTSSARELEAVQRQLSAVSNSTRTGIQETVDLYTRLARSAGDLGMSQADVIRLTELTTKTLTVSGASAASASGALLQFSQALGGGVVRAEEFNSILEGMPVIIQEVAKSMGVTTAELRRMVNEGQVTSKQFAEAFLAANGRITDSFAKMGPTVEGALTQLSNAFAEAIGKGNQTGGTTEELARAISDLSEVIRENQELFDLLAKAMTFVVDLATKGVSAFGWFSQGVDIMAEEIAGLAKATEGLANFDSTAWTEGVNRVNLANAKWEAHIRSIGRAIRDEGLDRSPGMSTDGMSFMRGLTGPAQLSATPFGMFGGLSAGGSGAAVPPRVAPAMKADADAMREAARAAKDLQEALDKTNFSSGLAREKAIEHTNALRQFVQPVKMGYAEVLTFVQAQERAANAAAAHATAVRLGIASTVAYRAEVMTATQVEDLRAKGLTVTTEQIDRLRQANERLVQSQDAKGPESPVAQTQAWTDSLRDAIGVVQLLGQAFGDVGRTVSSIGTGAQSIVSGLQRASSIKNAQGQAVGIGGALSGAAGITGVISGLGAAGAVVGGLVQIGDALDLFGRKAKERAREIAEATKRFNEGVAAFQTRALGQESAVGNAIEQASKTLQGLIAEAQKSFRGGALNRETVRVQGLYDASLEQIAGGFFTSLEDAFDRLNGNELAINIRRAGEELRERENAIMALRKSGAITAEEEAAALIRVKDLYDQTIASMEAAAAAAKAAADAEEKRRLAQQAFDRKQFGLDLTQRRQTLSGDTRGAFQTGQTIAANSALAQAQQLVEAGTITADMFEQLRTLIGDEMVAALDAFDAAVAESALQQREDLEVRALVASGRSAEAAQRRIEIANRRELFGVTDEATRAEILRVQAIEEGARALEAAAEAERRRQEQNSDIDRRMISVLQTLDPARAKQLQQMQTEADRAREIAEAADDATRARLRELHAMEDAAEALAVLTKAQEEAARIAREQAEFTSSLNVQYLRSQGRGFDADVTELNEWRTTQRKLSASLGFGEGSEQWRQIDAVYASRYNALIAGTMQQDTAMTTPPATDPGSTILGEDTIAVRSARSISESTALQLVDYAASQTALLRRLVQLAEGGSGPTGEALVSPSLDLVERRMGSRASTSAMLMGGVVR